MIERLDLTAEEWEALQRINRGPPESRLVPGIVAERLVELGLATERAGQRRISPRGRELIMRERHGMRR